MDETSTSSWPHMKTSKIDAAKRQLDTAITLLFNEGDALSIHTLAFAVFGLLTDISKKSGKTDTLIRLEDDAKQVGKKEFWSNLKHLSNFLKHADKDTFSFSEKKPEELNEIILLTNCFLLREVDELSSHETQSLWLWYHALFFINIDDTPEEYWQWVERYHDRFHSEKRIEKLKLGKILLDALKMHDFSSFDMTPDQILMPWRFILTNTQNS